LPMALYDAQGGQNRIDLVPVQQVLGAHGVATTAGDDPH